MLQTDLTGFEAGDMNLFRYCHNDPVNKSDPTGLYWVIPEKLRDAFDAARQRMSQDAGMKKIFDTVAADKQHKVTVVGVSGKGENHFYGTNKGNGILQWNPQNGLRTKDGGGQSPAMALGHEAAHAERYLRDPAGYIRDSAPLRDASGRPSVFGNREEQRVITGPERNAAMNPLIHESVRNEWAGRMIEVPSVDSVPR